MQAHRNSLPKAYLISCLGDGLTDCGSVNRGRFEIKHELAGLPWFRIVFEEGHSRLSG